MRVSVPPGVCPNCGSKAYDEESGFCIHCFWQVGDDHFCPHWMKKESWIMGFETGWSVPSRVAAKRRGK